MYVGYPINDTLVIKYAFRHLQRVFLSNVSGPANTKRSYGQMSN